MAQRLGMPIEQTLVERGRIPYKFLLKQLARTWGVSFVDLKISDVKREALEAINEGYARSHLLVPFELADKELQLAMWNPRDRQIIDEIQRMTGKTVVPYLAPENAIRHAQLLYRADIHDLLERATLDESQRVINLAAEETTAVALLDRVLEFAAAVRATDIHIEPYELEAIVRYRIDGLLYEMLSLPAELIPGLVSRTKIMAGMRIDERRAPQDGRFDADLGGYKLDLRVSSMPTLWGEKIVIRLLPLGSTVFGLEDLGMGESEYEIFVRNIMRPHGMILVTGPTGCGKTTTLYAAVNRLGTEHRSNVNITTIEDPIEYTIPRVSQIRVNAATGVTFASGLRSILRQDPDIIMIGEIRDSETADVAIRAALIGRLLFSTLHTNDATGAVARLLDIGVEPFLLASTLVLVVAQRLVRRICTSCRESIEMDTTLMSTLRSRTDLDQAVRVLQREGVLSKEEDPLSKVRVFRGKGCQQCNGSGFRGRLGIFELFEIDDQFKQMIVERRGSSLIRAAAIEKGMKTMLQDGLAKAFLGETTLDEVLRVAI
ncbi:MAG: type II/IV secretion system protein [Deltaproteobacteria bacterium]|nr:type II/IV secretion system protein [Deltaproteobacteria bacterium]